jgi:hypothetical protein
LGFREAFLQVVGAEVIFATELIEANLVIPGQRKMRI